MRRAVIGEAVALAVAIAVVWWLGGRATTAWLARVDELAIAARPTTDVVRGMALEARLYFTAGIVALAAARTWTWIRDRDPIEAPALIPAVIAAALIGLVVQLATVEVAGGAVIVPTGAAFAQGFVVAAIAGAAIIVAPIDLAGLASRFQIVVGAAIAGLFVALAVAGTGPGGSGTRINLGPVQPIEAVKVLAVVFLGAFLGRRAAKLRWHRKRVLGLRWPRVELIAPALVALIAIFGGLFVVGDLGPMMVLAVVFLGLFFVATRSTGWIVAAIAVVGGLLVAIAVWPGLVDTGRIATRIAMWNDPWTNGLDHGHQVGEGLWAIAAGGMWGQGLAGASLPLPAAGKTDLVLAVATEQIGAVGAIAYLGTLATIVVSVAMIAARNRTPERVMIVAGAGLLVVVQWAVIHFGTLGQLPLTGIVVPFMSTGRSSMIAFVVVVAIASRLARDGRVRAASAELDELRGAVRGVAIVACGAFAAGAVLLIYAAVIDGDDRSARGIARRLDDGTVVNAMNPRLVALADAIRRGTIADRDGAPLAITDAVGAPRRYPLGSALGTLLGVDPSPTLRPAWSLERQLDHRLRGYPERTGGPRYRDIDPRGPDAPLPWPDLRALAPLLSMSKADRAARVAAIDAAIDQRSVRLSIDGELQSQIATLVRGVVGDDGKLPAAAAAVVIDVDSGRVLARVQAPDLDPADHAWHDRLAGEIRATDPRQLRLTGKYGAWQDKTGLRGVFQSGSIGKLFTALAAARAGVLQHAGDGCEARTAVRYACSERDDKGPFYTRPGWGPPVHDHAADPLHGEIDAVEAIAVSCNVFFAQLGVDLGPAPLVDLNRAGADVGFAGRAFDPGEPHSRQLASTAFGQGAMATSPLQAARLAAAIAGGGTYRICREMTIDEKCTAHALVVDPAALAPIVAGMRRVMTDGTGRGLDQPDGVRVYGKTGTADEDGADDEAAWGIAPGRDAPPHAWFVAFAEPTSTPACAVTAPGRIAVAVVVPRGGTGARRAGPLAMAIVAAVRDRGYFGR